MSAGAPRWRWLARCGTVFIRAAASPTQPPVPRSLLLLLAIVTASLAHAQAPLQPEPDPSFNGGESITTTFRGPVGWGWAVRAYPDGRAVALSSAGNEGPAVVRYLADGTPDPAFGDDGVALLTVASRGDDGRAEPGTTGHLHLLPDGRILFALNRTLGRLMPDGTPDASFGSGGMVTIPDTRFFRSSRFAVAPAGDIFWTGFGRLGTSRRMIVIKLTPDGELDESFGPAGEQMFGPENMRSHDIAVRGGRIWVAGSPIAGTTNMIGSAVARLHMDGSPDLDFGEDGFATLQHDGRTLAMAFQNDGRVVVAGPATSGNQQQIFAVRFTHAGQPDASFGEGGLFRTPNTSAGTHIFDLVALPDDRLLAVGSPALISISADGTEARQDHVVLNTGAAWVGSFEGVDVMPDGRVLVVGTARRTSPPLTNDLFFLRRLNTSLGFVAGSDELDPTFGRDGIAVEDAGGSNLPLDMAVLPDRSLLTLSAFNNGGALDYRLLKLRPDGSRDPSYGTDGLKIVPVPFAATALLPLPAGDFYLVGSELVGSERQLVLARVTATGDLDPAFGDGGFIRYPAVADVQGGRYRIHRFPDGALLILTTVRIGPGIEDMRVAVVRIAPDGALDLTYGSGGFALMGASGLLAAAALHVEPDGRARALFNASGAQPVGVVALTASGAIETGYGADGYAWPAAPSGYQGQRLLRRPDGGLLVVGADRLIALTAGGAVDHSYGDAGTAVLTFDPAGGATPRVLDAELLADGSMVATGMLFASGEPNQGFVGRVLPDGTVDATFGDGGSVRTRMSSVDIQRTIRLDPAGRAVSAGDTQFLGRRGIVFMAVEAGAPVAAEPHPQPLASLATFPNPAGARATVRVELDAPGEIRLELFDLLGRRVALLAEGPRQPGRLDIPLDAAPLAAGTYLLRLTTGHSTAVQRISIVR
jgi:uncharacterized delta-60 repeat protein